MKRQAEQTYVFDFIRKKWLVLTPEEWVRQHLLNYLISVKHYSPSSISVEKELQLNDTKKRFDVVVYDRALQPLIVVECKAPYIALDQLVIEQAQRYNLILAAPILMISNGVSDLVFDRTGKIIELPDKEIL